MHNIIQESDTYARCASSVHNVLDVHYSQCIEFTIRTHSFEIGIKKLSNNKPHAICKARTNSDNIVSNVANMNNEVEASKCCTWHNTKVLYHKNTKDRTQQEHRRIRISLEVIEN